MWYFLAAQYYTPSMFSWGKKNSVELGIELYISKNSMLVENWIV